MTTLHPACAALPPLPESEFTDLVASIQANGQLVKILRMPNGDLLDGNNRLRACERLGIEPIYEAPYTGDDPWGVVAALNCQRRQMTLDQKREFIRQMLIAKPQRPNKQIAETVKVSHVTVGKIRHGLETECQIDNQGFITTKDGKKRPAHNKPKGQPKPPKRAFINPPIQSWTKEMELTEEERGIPADADVYERGDHYLKYGRVQIVPKTARDMMNARDLWTGVTGHIGVLAGAHLPTPEQMFEAIDQLLAHVHTPKGRFGNEKDYHRIALGLLRELEKTLPLAITRLQALAEVLAQRRPRIASSNGQTV
jgi:hypothetical protein